MYALFEDGTDNRHFIVSTLQNEFVTPEAANSVMLICGWKKITPTGKDDVRAWEYPHNGRIVVLRSIRRTA